MISACLGISKFTAAPTFFFFIAVSFVPKKCVLSFQVWIAMTA